MKNNFGFLSTNIKELDTLNTFPNNLYFFCCIDKKNINSDNICHCINFLMSNDCSNIITNSLLMEKEIKKILRKYKNINFIYDNTKIKSYSNTKKIIIYNQTSKKYNKKINNAIDYQMLNFYRKDEKPENTIQKIKNILENNDIKVKETSIRKNFNGIYSIRLELKDGKGVNGKGLSLKLAKASAYAELMERLQSNMLNKNRKKTNQISKDKNLYFPLLNNASEDYKKDFFKLDDIYFNVEKALNIKTMKYETIPINAINCFCHTNGLASGNTFSEAVSQAIFEILERYCYQELLKKNLPIYNINIDNYPLNKKNQKILNKFKKKGYKYYIKDCSLGKYPVLGFMLLNNDETKYTFTIASDYSFDIALSRCITEMLQGYNLKNLNTKMLKKESLKELNKKYKNNFNSYNWLKCFNNNNGYLSENFFCNDNININELFFKNYITDNELILEQLKKDIEHNIYIKDYNKLGFDTYRVYIPYISAVDCYDIDDLIVNKNYNTLYNIYTNILKASKKELNFFIDIFLKLNKNIKYDELIKPADLFHLTEITDYYKLDFTSLLIILTAITNRRKDLIKLLNFKINNFNLTPIKDHTYKIIVNLLSHSKIYNINNLALEKSLKEIFDNPNQYLSSLNPISNITNDNELFNKKSLL